MKGTLVKKFTFDAAHFLPAHTKCHKMHGHTWTFEVAIEGPVEDGMLVDFGVFKDFINEVIINKFDHELLNNFVFFPSCENLCEWIWNKLTEYFGLKHKVYYGRGYINLKSISLKYIKLCETPNSCFIYEGKK